MPTDPNSELTQISEYAQAAQAYISVAGPLIAQLEAASTANPAPTDSDSPDVEAAIQKILEFQAANPIPPAPSTVIAGSSAASSVVASPKVTNQNIGGGATVASNTPAMVDVKAAAAAGPVTPAPGSTVPSAKAKD